MGPQVERWFCASIFNATANLPGLLLTGVEAKGHVWESPSELGGEIGEDEQAKRA